MAEGILTLNPISPERDPDKLGGPGYIEAPVGAGIGLALANMFKKRGIGDNNPPSPKKKSYHNKNHLKARTLEKKF